MSSLERGQRQEQIVRNAAPAVERQALNTSLTTPGLVAAPPISSGAQMLDSALNALGMVGRAAEQVGQFAGQVAAEKRRTANEQKELQRQRAEIQRGLASTDYRTELPGIETAIAERKLTVPDGVSVEDFAREYVDARVDNMDPEYRDTYRSGMVPALARAFYAQQEQMKSDAQTETLRLFKESAVEATTFGRLEQIKAAAKGAYPTLTDTEIASTVLLPAAKSAAENADKTRFDVAMQALGEHFPAERLSLTAKFTEAMQQQENRRATAFSNQIDGMFIDHRSGRTSFDAIESSIQKARGTVPDAVIQNKLSELDTAKKATIADATKRVLQTEMDRFTATAASETDSAINGGLVAGIEEASFTDSAGHVHRITRQDRIDQGFTRAFQRIASTSANQDEAFARMVDLASKNNYAVPTWERLIAGGATAATEQALAASEKGGKEEPMPPATIAGFDLYRKLKAMSPQLLETMVKDEKVRDFYETASILQEDTATGQDDRAALLGARRILSRPGGGVLNDVQDRDVKSAAVAVASRYWSADAVNTPEIASLINRRARTYIRAGLNPDAAVARARKQVEDGGMIINKWWQPLYKSPMPPEIKDSLDPLARGIIDEWVAKYGEDDGVEASDLTIRPGFNNNYFVVSHGATGAPVSSHGDPKSMMFDIQDLIERSKSLEKKKAEAAAAKVIEDQHLAATANIIRQRDGGRHNLK